MFTSSR
jgi:hypothetical protein